MATTVVIAEERLEELRLGFSGTLLRPDDEGYEAARRVHNGLIDRRPALIARCRSAADIADAVRFARAAGLEIWVRGGGHNVAGRAVVDDALMIDLSLMKGIHVDPQARRCARRAARSGASSTARRPSTASPTTGGAISTTGIAGLTLGGGLGWLMAKYGLAADNLLASSSSPPTATSSTSPTSPTPISSGRCGAAAATSASPRRSSTGCTRCR